MHVCDSERINRGPTFIKDTKDKVKVQPSSEPTSMKTYVKKLNGKLDIILMYRIFDAKTIVTL